MKEKEEIMSQLDEENLQELFAWVDEIPLSRPKKTITRDFSDGGKFSEDEFNSSIIGMYDNCLFKKVNNVNMRVESQLHFI